MESFFTFFGDLYEWSDIGLLALRIAVGGIFLAHGIGKWKLWKAGAETPMQGLMKMLSITEPLAGAGVLAGLLTQVAAVALGVIMLGALYFKIFVWKKRFTEPGGWELDLVILAAVIALTLFGAGWMSLDYYFFNLI